MNVRLELPMVWVRTIPLPTIQQQRDGQTIDAASSEKAHNC